MTSLQVVQLTILMALLRCDRRWTTRNEGVNPSEFRGLQVWLVRSPSLLGEQALLPTQTHVSPG